MWELVKAGGWLMMPIVLCSIFMLIVMIERGVKLRFCKVAPDQLREQLTERLLEQGMINREQLLNVKENSPLGDILATGLLYRQYGLESMSMHMQNRASVQIHQLEKNINMLGTIGAVAPLLGLLGTVLGIITSFLAITDGSMQDPAMLAAGVSQALITTAAGMFVAIPAVIAYRFYQRRIVDINAHFEREAGLMVQDLLDKQLIGYANDVATTEPNHTHLTETNS
ncbi:MotA/TolQ/ExbB proton channel [Moraxella macacae 0408225]|uniref:MotA/TolQ/ExbB proton channel n=1 Tax=Moraxella macacae 0408225 TaxID=1230338 RepID=L2F6T8_9GAMM|nr:MotA/TolQ/ExbB proton channel family protein [Moraxella macacae]ELA08153.1 MotA/TolQ/ExbB proton channel [Moraxella macacae 0408225]